MIERMKLNTVTALVLSATLFGCATMPRSYLDRARIVYPEVKAAVVIGLALAEEEQLIRPGEAEMARQSLEMLQGALDAGEGLPDMEGFREMVDWLVDLLVQKGKLSAARGAALKELAGLLVRLIEQGQSAASQPAPR